MHPHMLAAASNITLQSHYNTHSFACFTDANTDINICTNTDTVTGTNTDTRID